MAKVSLDIKPEKPPLEDIEAANILLLLWERTIARNKRMEPHQPFINIAATHARNILQNRHHQQHVNPFQQLAPDYPGLPLHYYFSPFTPQGCILPQPLLSYYGLTPSCYVGPVRMDANSTPLPPPPVAFEGTRTSASSECDVCERKRPSSKQTSEAGTSRARRPRDSSEKPEAKRRRKNLTKEQVRVLEEAYSTSKYPQVEDRVRLQGPTKLSESRIQVWFQNRRAKERREAERHQGSQENDSTSSFKDCYDNSQESTETEDEIAGDKTGEHSGENKVLDSYAEEKLLGNVKRFAK